MREDYGLYVWEDDYERHFPDTMRPATRAEIIEALALTSPETIEKVAATMYRERISIGSWEEESEKVKTIMRSQAEAVLRAVTEDTP